MLLRDRSDRRRDSKLRFNPISNKFENRMRIEPMRISIAKSELFDHDIKLTLHVHHHGHEATTP
jgi:hypothetical protein